jgi:hypothetical protein
MAWHGIRHLPNRRYIQRIDLSYDIWIFWDICIVYTRYIPGIYMPCNLKLDDPVRNRIAIEMQRHTDFGLQGCLMLSPERGGAIEHPSARASPDPSGRRLQSRATVVRVGGRGGVAPPPPTPTSAAAARRLVYTSYMTCLNRNGRNVTATDWYQNVLESLKWV